MKDFTEMEKLFQVKFQQRVKAYSLILLVGPGSDFWAGTGQACISKAVGRLESSLCHTLQPRNEGPCWGSSAAGRRAEGTNGGVLAAGATPRVKTPGGCVTGTEAHSSPYFSRRLYPFSFSLQISR